MGGAAAVWGPVAAAGAMEPRFEPRLQLTQWRRASDNTRAKGFTKGLQLCSIGRPNATGKALYRPTNCHEEAQLIDLGSNAHNRRRTITTQLHNGCTY